MKKLRTYSLAAILIFLTQNSNAQKVKLLKTTLLDNYPSASAMQFVNNNLYIMGDDATHLYILNNEHQILDSFQIFSSLTRRINKDEKADIEAIAAFSKNGDDQLFMISSFSTQNRNQLIQVKLGENGKAENKKAKTAIFKHVDVKESNVEGAVFISDNLILANRANLTNKVNQLAVTKFKKRIRLGKEKKIINIELPPTENVIGISGLEYLPQKDLLIFTASTELTTNAYSDGEIGKSYLGFIENISQKINNGNIKVENLTEISSILSKTVLYKIESLTIESFKDKEIILHLAADNDNGKSTLFKINVSLP